ncbi:hypothetical protein P4O66_015474, partial [Electrophorus voltai]
DCAPAFTTNSIIKFADDTMVTGLISSGDESAYGVDVQNLSWEDDYAPVSMSDDRVERVPSFRFQGIHISEDLTWPIPMPMPLDLSPLITPLPLDLPDLPPLITPVP